MGQVNLADAVVLKAGNVHSVTERHGSLAVGEPHPFGVWMDDCRYLDGHELRIGGERPQLLVASARSGHRAVHQLALEDLHVRLERRLDPAGGMTERLILNSSSREPTDMVLELRLTADFAPMLAVRGILPLPERARVRAEARPRGLWTARRGEDGVERSTTITSDPAPAAATADAAGTLRYELALPAGGEHEIVLRYSFEESGARSPSPAPPDDPPVTRAASDDELFNRLLDRSLLDVRMLRSHIGGQTYYAAGLPWYATLFGRDSLITAMQMLSWAPAVAERTLRLLASLIGRRDDPIHEEEPGKVIHELRVGEAARPGATPLARYYGTVDATPLFLCLLCDHADWSGSLALFRELQPQVEAMLGWIDRYGDHDGDGLLDYAARAPGGLRNQGWKDSEDGICHEDGSPLEPPIALVEVQGYAIRAKRGLARLYELDGDAATARRLDEEADALSERLDRFWIAGAGFYSMGIDADGRASRALASNQGHLLWSATVPPDRAGAVRDALMGEAMFSGWGIRTLAEGEAAYNPIAYHLGTVWPHDTSMIAAGLRGYGFDGDFMRIFEGLLGAASHADAQRLPELFAGFSPEQIEIPVPYPFACRPQAWAAGALPYLLNAGLGITAEGLDGRLLIRRPSLPHWVDRVALEGVRIAGSTVDLVFERAGRDGAVGLSEVRVDGKVEVVVDVTGAR
jgi:glycogen debranching enzyme